MLRLVDTLYRSSVPIAALIWMSVWLVAMGFFLGHYSFSKQAVYGDGIGYYAWGRSWVADGDSDTTNEYRHIYNGQNNNAARPAVSDVVQIVSVSPNGRAANHFSPGPALLFLPGLLLAHGITNLVNTTGSELATTGYGDLYQILAGVVAVNWFVVGMSLGKKWLDTTTPGNQGNSWAVLALWLGSPLLYYSGYDVLNSHFAAWLMICAWWWWYWPRRRSDVVLATCVTGLLAGATTLIRPQDGVIVLIWLIDQLILHRDFQKQNTTFQFKTLFKKIFFFATAWAIPIFFLLYHWLITFGSLTGHLYLEEVRRPIGQSVDWLGSWWHPVTGIFTRTPYVFLMVVYGVLRFVNRKASQLEKYLALFGVMEWLIISWQGGWYAAAFGGRMYITSLLWPLAASTHFWKNTVESKTLPKNTAHLLLVGIASLTITSMILFILQT